MGLLETVIIALGGPAILIAAVAFMTKSLLSQWLTKEMKRHEADLNRDSRQFELELKGKYDAAAERLKSDLQRQSSEHQILFSKLHERRAEVIAEIYRKLVEALWDVESALSPLQVEGEPPLAKKYNTAHNKLVDFYRYFDVHKLYLPAEVCEKTDAIFSEIRTTLIRFGTYLRYNDNALPSHVLEQKLNQEIQAWEKIKTDVPMARNGLEEELRRLLGDRGAPEGSAPSEKT